MAAGQIPLSPQLLQFSVTSPRSLLFTPTRKGEKRWIQIKLHVPSVARMLPLFIQIATMLGISRSFHCKDKVFQNTLFTSKAAAITITPRYNILCTQRFSLKNIRVICSFNYLKLLSLRLE
ncbi:uncharacterized protein LOC112096836 [Citrus clementina]|uniref:uncharacterized protein LOC112096836 n=1 Tax=Citrus clementina TaxID=85681 RepID=UPI000CED2A3E|nr:uncharacterized protein LOC112096836 [Citrus x clementina]